LELRRLECAALIGPNGSGKTTFLQTILEELEPLNGTLNMGASLKIGYFAQAHEDLDSNLTLIEEIDKVGTGMLEREIRGYLGRFLFSGDDHYKKVQVLSGGERGRLALAKLALIDANILLLDEPSNHLDIPAQEMLQEVLANFNGTIILVSHDRFLIDALATQVWEIKPKEHKLEIFKGTYSEYKGIVTEVQKKGKPEPIKNRVPLEIKKKSKISKHERQRLTKLIHYIEDRVIATEVKMEELSKKIQNTLDNHELIREYGEEYAYMESELARVMEEWEEINKKLED
jgi:ATP-binding cassette subfamily F protein 3